MGGLLSGGHNRRHYGTVEEYRRIDAGRLWREGAMKPGYAGRITWRSESGKENWIAFLAGEAGLELFYSWRRGDERWRDMRQKVQVINRDCRFGGSTALFLCPKCGASRKSLYGAQAEFLCRTCSHLTYATQREREYDRAGRRARKLRRRIGAEIGLGEWLGVKPKGMHYKTFDAIVAEIHTCEEVVEMQFVHILQRLKRIERKLPSRKTRTYWS